MYTCAWIGGSPDGDAHLNDGRPASNEWSHGNHCQLEPGTWNYEPKAEK